MFRRFIRSLFDRRIRIRLYALGMVIPLAACVACLPDDPVVYPTSATSAGGTVPAVTTNASDPNPESDPITIATPYSEEASEYLGMLYYSRLAGVFPENTPERIGDTVNLDELAQFRNSFPVEAIQTEPGGTGADRLRAWAASGRLPDIFMTDAVARAVNDGWAAEVTAYADSNPLLSLSSLYASFVEGAKPDGRLSGIPMFFSVPVISYDSVLARQYGMDIPTREGWGFPRFLDETVKVTAGSTVVSPVPTQTGTTPAATGKPSTGESDAALLSVIGLLEHLPCGMDYSLGWATWSGTGFHFEQPAMQEAANQVEAAAASWISADRMADRTSTAARHDGQPVFSGGYVMKIGDSTQIAAERARLGSKLGLARLPYLGTERIGAHVYSLCVSPAAAKSKSTVGFAVFVALDPDALLLASRFGLAEGFLPVSRDSTVWNHLVKAQSSGSFLMGYKDLLETSYVDGSTFVPGWGDKYGAVFQSIEKDLAHGILTASQAVERLVSES